MSTMTLDATIAAPRAARGCGAQSLGRLRTPSAPRPAASRRVVAPVLRPRASLRLTRRGRFVVLLLATAICVLASLVVTSSGAASDVTQHAPVEYVTVLPGDTLWNIANDVAPSADPRDTVAEIIELNALPGSTVQAGQRLAVPVHR